MIFEVLTKDPKTRARRGRLQTAHGFVETPVFMPVGTQATVKSMTGDQLQALNVEILLCNAYHLLLRPGHETIDRKSTRLNSSHSQISYAVFCLKKKKNNTRAHNTA